jgi:hypothetical protein
MGDLHDATSPIAFRRARPGRKQQLNATSAKSPPHTLSSFSFPGLRRARPGRCQRVCYVALIPQTELINNPKKCNAKLGLEP